MGTDCNPIPHTRVLLTQSDHVLGPMMEPGTTSQMQAHTTPRGIPVEVPEMPRIF